jgi:hypothetical protein
VREEKKNIERQVLKSRYKKKKKIISSSLFFFSFLRLLCWTRDAKVSVCVALHW